MTMTFASARFTSMLVLGGTLLAGGLLGSLVTSRVIDARMDRLNQMRTHDGFIQAFEEVVEPAGGEQHARVRAVLDRFAARVGDQSRTCRSERIATLDTMRRELAPLLDPAQQARLDAWFEQYRARHTRGLKSSP